MDKGKYRLYTGISAFILLVLLMWAVDSAQLVVNGEIAKTSSMKEVSNLEK